MNFQMFKLVLEKAEETDQIANICWIMEKAREFQKNIYFGFTDYTKAFFFFFLNFKIFNSYMRSQTWTPLPPPSP